MKTLHVLRKFQIFWAYFIGLGAVMGWVMFLYDPSGQRWGMDPLLPVLREGLPFFEALFDDFIASAWVLFLVVALPNGVSVALLHRHHRWALWSALLSGVFLLLWILLEFYIWGWMGLSVVYFFFALMQMGNAYLWIRMKKTHTIKY